jgi:hypothetical protein
MFNCHRWRTRLVYNVNFNVQSPPQDSPETYRPGTRWSYPGYAIVDKRFSDAADFGCRDLLMQPYLSYEA